VPDADLEKKFEFTDSSLTDFINQLVKMHGHPEIDFWIAVCTSKDHDQNQPWLGTKRSERRQAIRDAIEHKQTTGHRAGVIGPIE